MLLNIRHSWYVYKKHVVMKTQKMLHHMTNSPPHITRISSGHLKSRKSAV